MILANISSEMANVLLPVYLRELGTTVAQVGLVFSVMSTVLLVLQLFGGLFVRHAGATEASRLLLPADTRWVAIEGGNHGQFGWYGSQSGDNEATITRQARQEQVVAATVELLTELQ